MLEAAVALAALSMILAGCAAPPSRAVDTSASHAPEISDPASVGSPVQIPTSGWEPGDAGRDALITGWLAADATDCPYLGDRHGRHRLWIVWPAEFTARIVGDGKVELVGPDGSVVAKEGDHIEAGGALAGLRATKPMPCVQPGAVLTHIESELTVRPRSPS